MADYQYTDPINNGGIIRLSDGASIPNTTRNKDYREYLEYVDGGGETLPWKTDEELKDIATKDKLEELKEEYNKRIDTATGTSDPRDMNKMLMKQSKLIRKEAKGSASVDDIADLDAFDDLDDHLDLLDGEHDAAELYIEDPVRTIEEIEAYNVETDPNWSIMV